MAKTHKPYDKDKTRFVDCAKCGAPLRVKRSVTHCQVCGAELSVE